MIRVGEGSCHSNMALLLLMMKKTLWEMYTYVSLSFCVCNADTWGRARKGEHKLRAVILERDPKMTSTALRLPLSSGLCGGCALGWGRPWCCSCTGLSSLAGGVQSTRPIFSQCTRTSMDSGLQSFLQRRQL